MTEFTKELLHIRRGQELHNVALTAALLGTVGTLGLSFAAWFFCHYQKYYELPLYIALLCIFHFLEYYITAKYNPNRVNMNSFLLNNGQAYTTAQVVSTVECTVEYFIFDSQRYRFISLVGLVMAVMGQTFRSLAMIHASTNFNHIIQRSKNDDHKLVTRGIYQVSRHPSYFGFFYWSIGLQLFMLNPVTLFGFTIVLWRFFHARIADEEQHLVQFFGDEYIKFRQQVSTKIPFIR